MTDRIAMALCGVCLHLGLVGLLAMAVPGSADGLKHFAPVRFRVPPGAVVEVNGAPSAPALYLNGRLEHTVLVRHGGAVLLRLDRYRPPPGGEVFDLRPQVVVEVAPPPRPK